MWLSSPRHTETRKPRLTRGVFDEPPPTRKYPAAWREGAVGRVADVHCTLLHAMRRLASDGERPQTYSCALTPLSHRREHAQDGTTTGPICNTTQRRLALGYHLDILQVGKEARNDPRKG